MIQTADQARKHFIARHHDATGVAGKHMRATVSLARLLGEPTDNGYAGPCCRDASRDEVLRYRAWVRNQRFVVELADYRAESI